MARAARLLELLEASYPDARCELDFTSPHELLIATILSAQSTDVGVNKATPALFKAFRTPADYAASTPERIEPYIRTIGLFRNKAKAIHAAMTTHYHDGAYYPRGGAKRIPQAMIKALRRLGGQIRLRPMERVALDLFTDHYFGDERGGARHDHEIGATIQYDVLRGDRWAIHPILGACGLLPMAHAPQSDMTATDVRFGLRAGVGAELLVTSRLSLQAQAQVVAYVGHDFAPYAWPGGTADELSVRAVGQFHAAANVWF